MIKTVLLINLLLQDLSIEEKLNEAPDSSYGIGIFIGSMLPFILLVFIAYLIYNYNKNKSKSD